jgi:hypothetical protein
MKSIAFLVAFIMCGFAILMASLPEKPTHWGVKNCELSEISPDFTPQEKADCRIMRSKK